MDLTDFQYPLPEDRIARYPARPRDSSRLLVLMPTGPAEHHRFRQLPGLLGRGDLLVLNDTRVRRVRLLGRTPGGGEAEVFLLRPLADGTWEAMVRPGRRLVPGKRILFGPGEPWVEVLETTGPGKRRVRASAGAMERVVERLGHVPLPPYIHRPDEPKDRRSYQTVFAREGFSVAAPTAGLHFTPRVLQALDAAGVELARIRLDVGPGTFKPMTAKRVEDHVLDAETYFINEGDAFRISAALAARRRVVAVGTTVTRSLEDQLQRFGEVRPGAYQTSLFILPGRAFQAISGLVTNFHLPGSSLLALVSALSGRERILSAYGEALEAGYRFYSYGDAMLIWK